MLRKISLALFSPFFAPVDFLASSLGAGGKIFSSIITFPYYSKVSMPIEIDTNTWKPTLEQQEKNKTNGIFLSVLLFPITFSLACIAFTFSTALFLIASIINIPLNIIRTFKDESIASAKINFLGGSGIALYKTDKSQNELAKEEAEVIGNIISNCEKHHWVPITLTDDPKYIKSYEEFEQDLRDNRVNEKAFKSTYLPKSKILVGDTITQEIDTEKQKAFDKAIAELKELQINPFQEPKSHLQEIAQQQVSRSCSKVKTVITL